MGFCHSKHVESTFNKVYNTFLWRTGDDYKYVQALCTPQIQDRIESFMEQDVSSVEDSVNSVTEIIIDSAKSARISQKLNKPKKEGGKCKKKKLWYNTDCLTLKRDLKKAAADLRKCPSIAYLSHYRYLRKKYRSQLNMSRSAYKQNILNQMEGLSNVNPQEYWKLFDRLRELNSTAKTNQISTNEWFAHFSNLLNSVTGTINTSIESQWDKYIESNKDIFNELNFEITKKEVADAIGRLKKGKASGPDLVRNEMLKAGVTTILPMLHRLFNRILNSGIYPKDWRCNILLPLHKKGSPQVTDNYRGIAIGSCLAKLFCSVLNKRLCTFASANNNPKMSNWLSK